MESGNGTITIAGQSIATDIARENELNLKLGTIIIQILMMFSTLY